MKDELQVIPKIDQGYHPYYLYFAKLVEHLRDNASHFVYFYVWYLNPWVSHYQHEIKLLILTFCFRVVITAAIAFSKQAWSCYGSNFSFRSLGQHCIHFKGFLNALSLRWKYLHCWPIFSYLSTTLSKKLAPLHLLFFILHCICSAWWF